MKSCLKLTGQPHLGASLLLLTSSFILFNPHNSRSLSLEPSFFMAWYLPFCSLEKDPSSMASPTLLSQRIFTAYHWTRALNVCWMASFHLPMVILVCKFGWLWYYRVGLLSFVQHEYEQNLISKTIKYASTRERMARKCHFGDWK